MLIHLFIRIIIYLIAESFYIEIFGLKNLINLLQT